jgi:hypothetical protein
MKLLIPAICVLFAAQQPFMIEARRLYVSCAFKKDSLVKLGELVKASRPDDQPVLYCYAGAVQIIMAKYVSNPFTKFSNFKKGRLMMEEAITKDTASFEMRYLRLSIQSSLPSFLDYHDQIAEDQYFLKTNIDRQSDRQLREMAVTLLNSKNKQN